jgi:mxaJ protein
LLANADEKALSRWPAPATTAAEGVGPELAGALVVDATGVIVGKVIGVNAGRIVLEPATTRPLHIRDVIVATHKAQEPAIIAAPMLNPRALRVCADPNNLPFTDQQEAGFENATATLIARELGATLQYVWWPERRGFLRRTLQAHHCDVVMGLPTGYPGVLTTQPVYRSGYVFVYGPRAAHASSTASPELRAMRIGVPLVGDDGANPPVTDALVENGLVNNLRGYPVYGDYRAESPPAELIRAVSRGDVDVAVAWGPLAGYYAARMSPVLAIAPLADPDKRFSFDISLAVRREDSSLRAELDVVLARRRSEIGAILHRYHVPSL